MKNAFELENISFSYGKRKLFKDLNLKIPSGSICAVMGPNGSGKSTLLHLLLGWLKPDSGRILVFHNDINRMDSRNRGKTMSLLPQKENLNFDYTVMEYILMGRAPHLTPLQQPASNDRKIAVESLNYINSLNLQNRRIPTLSGGESQTMLTARSLTQEPQIFLLDEPANHLDPARKRKMLNIIGDLQKKKRTVVFTTHNPQSTIGLADYLIMINSQGKIECGYSGQLFTEEKLSALYGIPMKIISKNGITTVHY